MLKALVVLLRPADIAVILAVTALVIPPDATGTEFAARADGCAVRRGTSGARGRPV